MSVGPDIAELLAQLGGEEAGGFPGGPPGGGLSPAPSGEQPVELLRQIVQLWHEFLRVEPDEEDKLEGTKGLQLAQKLLAKDQADQDAALGGSNMRILRKVAS